MAADGGKKTFVVTFVGAQPTGTTPTKLAPKALDGVLASTPVTTDVEFKKDGDYVCQQAWVQFIAPANIRAANPTNTLAFDKNVAGIVARIKAGDREYDVPLDAIPGNGVMVHGNVVGTPPSNAIGGSVGLAVRTQSVYGLAGVVLRKGETLSVTLINDGTYSYSTDGVADVVIKSIWRRA